MTAQDQQSRAEFEATMRAEPNHWVNRDFYRDPLGADLYEDRGTQAAWSAWQAARALPAGMEPVGWVDKRSIDWLADLGRGPNSYTQTQIHKSCEGVEEGQAIFTAAQVQAMLAQSDMGIPISAPLPPGWQAVPVEPTEEMKRGAQMAAMDHSDHDEWLEYEWQDVLRTWKGLLAAAPRPPAAQPDTLAKIAEVAACFGADWPDVEGEPEVLRRVKWAARQLNSVQGKDTA